MVSWTYSKLLGSIWDQSGIQEALTSKIPPFGGYPFLNLFGPIFDKFSFLHENVRIFECKFESLFSG